MFKNQTVKNQITITPMLDEEDGTPVFAVSDGRNATNVTAIEDALELAGKWVQPAKTLDEMAREWITAHGSNILDDMQEDVEEEFEVNLTEDQYDSFCNMLANCKITVEFPYGWGVPPIE